MKIKKEPQAKERGITLIALVITIIILLILAGITIGLVTGDNGLLAQATRAKEETENAQIKEEEVLTNYEDYINNSTLDTAVVGKIVTGNNKQYSNNGMAIIPEGFMIVPGCDDVSKGLVISDNQNDTEADGSNVVAKGNQFVWVPVEDVNVLHESSTSEELLSGSVGITTSKYSKSIINGQTRGKPGTNSYREPDILPAVGYDDIYCSIAGYMSLENMAQIMVNEYNTMISSIEKYGGFYIGRYELTNDGEKPGVALTNTNWYNLYAKCKEIAKDNSNITTAMIWGCQWDAVCNWLVDAGYDILDSSSWGNYSNNTVSGAGKKQNTGYSESWKANNIYDFAGNCYEWTQEAFSTNKRVDRGGGCTSDGKTTSASYHSEYNSSPITEESNNVRYTCYFNIKTITQSDTQFSSTVLSAVFRTKRFRIVILKNY